MPDTFKLVYQTFNSWTKLLCVIVEERNIQKSVIILQPNGKNRHKFNIFWWLASYFCNNNLFEVAYFGALFTDCEYRNSFISILWQFLYSCNASTWSEQRDIWRRFFRFTVKRKNPCEKKKRAPTMRNKKRCVCDGFVPPKLTKRRSKHVQKVFTTDLLPAVVIKKRAWNFVLRMTM